MVRLKYGASSFHNSFLVCLTSERYTTDREQKRLLGYAGILFSEAMKERKAGYKIFKRALIFFQFYVIPLPPEKKRKHRLLVISKVDPFAPFALHLKKERIYSIKTSCFLITVKHSRMKK